MVSGSTLCDKCSQVLGHFHGMTERKPKNKKWGRPGNEARSSPLVNVKQRVTMRKASEQGYQVTSMMPSVPYWGEPWSVRNQFPLWASGVARSLVLAGHLLDASPLACTLCEIAWHERDERGALAGHVPGQAWPSLHHCFECTQLLQSRMLISNAVKDLMARLERFLVPGLGNEDNSCWVFCLSWRHIVVGIFCHTSNS